MCILDTYRPLLVTACKEGRVKVWDITSTRKLRLVDEVVGLNFRKIFTYIRFKVTSGSVYSWICAMSNYVLNMDTLNY